MPTETDIMVAVPDAMLADIDRLAAARGRDRAWVIRHALSELIAEEAAIDAFIQEGIDSLENEPTLSQTEVRAWLADRRQHRIAAE